MSEKLQEALSRLQDEEWNRLEREDGPVHVFSEAFENRMEEILREEKRQRRRKRMSRIRSAAAVFVLCVLAGFGMIVAGRRLISPEDGGEIAAESGEQSGETSAAEISMEAESGEGSVFRYAEIRLGLGAVSDTEGYAFSVVNDSDSSIVVRSVSWKLCYLGSLRSGKNLKTLMRFSENPRVTAEDTLEEGRGVTVMDPLSDSLETEDTWIPAGKTRDFLLKYGAEVMTEEGMYLLVTTWSYTNDSLAVLAGEEDGLIAALVVVP